MKVLAAALLAVLPLAAQHGVGGLTNPYTSADDVETGQEIYRLRCAVCHGPQGAGGKGTDLTQGRFRHGSSDSDLFAVIADGVQGTEMPGVELSGERMWQLVAYVRSLSEGRAAEQATGDAKRGRELFLGKGNCVTCHRAAGRGSRTGPDLSHIGAQRSIAHLEESILDPGRQVRAEHWYVEAVRRDGSRVRGRRLNEDTVSVQVLDTGERLVSLLKDELTEYRVLKRSAMPSYRKKLSSAEVDDVVAFLAAQR